MPSVRRRTPEERDWLFENVPAMRPEQCRAAFLDLFGWLPTQTAWDVWNQRRGLHHDKASGGTVRRCERLVRWSDQPEMTAWMLEHDRGRDTKSISEDFRAAFGFGLTKSQITGFRMSHGTTTKPGTNGGRWHERPVGFESPTKNGYIVVKVAEKPKVPGSKDNWRFKHHLTWERANGRPVPEGCDIVFANGDMRDFDPGNLVAVPHRMQARLKYFDYWDAESLRVAMARVQLEGAVIEAEDTSRICPVCGGRFRITKEVRRRNNGVRPRCCPECRRTKAYRLHPSRAWVPKGEGVCAVCGSVFVKRSKAQRRCPECIAAAPTYSVDAARRAAAKRERDGQGMARRQPGDGQTAAIDAKEEACK